MRICDLYISFPDLIGVSDKQVAYAEHLRKQYVKEHIERFEYLDAELFSLPLNEYEPDEIQEFYDDFKLTLTERLVLNCDDAGGLIGGLLNENKGNNKKSNGISDADSL